MKAIVVSKVGGPANLRLQEVEDPIPDEGEVVVDVEAAGLNFIDTYHRSGLYELELPFTPGQEGAGVVSEVGSGVVNVAVGDRVAWATTLGTYADKVAVPAQNLVEVPEGITMRTAAGLLLQGLTAHYLATDTYPLSDGDLCLIHAGAGGVGTLLTQIAKNLGARVVTTVGSETKAQLSRAAGADHVIIYTEESFVEAAESIVGKRAFDVVYDGVGAATFEGGLELLRPRGMMVTFGNASGPVQEISPLILASHGSLFLTRPSLGAYISTPDELNRRSRELFEWVRSGAIDPGEPTVFPLSDARQAHEALEGRKTTGKVILEP